MDDADRALAWHQQQAAAASYYQQSTQPAAGAPPAPPAPPAAAGGYSSYYSQAGYSYPGYNYSASSTSGDYSAYYAWYAAYAAAQSGTPPAGTAPAPGAPLSGTPTPPTSAPSTHWSSLPEAPAPAVPPMPPLPPASSSAIASATTSTAAQPPPPPAYPAAPADPAASAAYYYSYYGQPAPPAPGPTGGREAEGWPPGVETKKTVAKTFIFGKDSLPPALQAKLQKEENERKDKNRRVAEEDKRKQDNKQKKQREELERMEREREQERKPGTKTREWDRDVLTSGPTKKDGSGDKKEKGKNDGLPPGLTDYVQRVFDSVEVKHRGHVELLLTQMIEKANRENWLRSVNWTVQPIPASVLPYTKSEPRLTASSTQPPPPPTAPHPNYYQSLYNRQHEDHLQNHGNNNYRSSSGDSLNHNRSRGDSPPYKKSKRGGSPPYDMWEASANVPSPKTRLSGGSYISFKDSSDEDQPPVKPSKSKKVVTRKEQQKIAAEENRKRNTRENQKMNDFFKTESEDKIRAREERFRQQQAQSQQKSGYNVTKAQPMKRMRRIVGSSVDIDLDNVPPCEGRSDAMEKDFLRLTTAPDPALVRPEHVLKKSLPFILNKSKEKNDPVWYINQQFKAIRQDLTVQRINTLFTTEVYETAALFALKHNDTAEFNQCQANLKNLYAAGLVRKPETVIEFLAYRMLYTLFSGAADELNRELGELTIAQRNHPLVQHAMQVVDAWTGLNYIRLNKLYKKAPNLGKEVMDLFRRNIAEKIYPRLLKPYRPGTMPLLYVKAVCFPDPEKKYTIKETGKCMWEDFLKRVQPVSVTTASGEVELDTKASLIAYNKTMEQITYNPGFE